MEAGVRGAATGGAAAGGSNGPWPIRGRDWALAALTVLPALALAVVAIVSVGHGYHGADDNAMTELRVSEIGRHWPQIGPFSRDGWSHPGPALFYLLVLPYRLTGSHANGLLVGAALLNAAAVAGMVLLARRRGGTALALIVALGALVLMRSLGGTFVWHPWNPFVTVLPFGLALFATWCAVCGDAWCLPLLVVVGSFCAQTHVGYVPLVAVLLVVAAIGLVLHRRSARAEGTGPTRPVRTPLIVAGVLLVLCWAPTIYQQLTADRGNVTAIRQYFESAQAAHGLRDGLRVVTAQFAWNPGWLVGRTDVNAFTAQPNSLTHTSWPVWWVALVLALAWCWRARSSAARALGVLLVVMTGVAVIAVARTLGPIFEYRLRFVWVLGMLTAAYALWVLTIVVAPRVRPGSGLAVAATAFALTAIVGLGAYGAATAASTDPPNQHAGRVVAALMPQLRRRLPSRAGVVVPSVRTFAEGPLLPGVIVDLEQHHVPVRVHDTRDDRLRYGDQRMLAGEPVRAELRIAVDDEIDRVAATPCARRLAYWGRASPARRARARRAAEQARRAYAAHRLSAREMFRRLQRLGPDLPAAAIFETDCPAGGP